MIPIKAAHMNTSGGAELFKIHPLKTELYKRVPKSTSQGSSLEFPLSDPEPITSISQPLLLTRTSEGFFLICLFLGLNKKTYGKGLAQGPMDMPMCSIRGSKLVLCKGVSGKTG